MTVAELAQQAQQMADEGQVQVNRFTTMPALDDPDGVQMLFLENFEPHHELNDAELIIIPVVLTHHYARRKAAGPSQPVTQQSQQITVQSMPPTQPSKQHQDGTPVNTVFVRRRSNTIAA